MNRALRWVFVVLMILPLAVQADLTGTWQANDGGIYYLRQTGEELHWYGEQNATEPRWANVFHGRIRGERINGDWLDVPKGKTLGSGKLSLTLSNNGQVLERSRETGGFGGSRWTRVGALPEPVMQPAPVQRLPVKPVQPRLGTQLKPVVPIKEDCIGFNPSNTSVTQLGNRWKIVEDNHLIFDFADKRDEARLAHRIIRHYGINQTCYVGRPQPSFTYLLVNGTAPAGGMQGEDCVTFNNAAITVVQAGGRWKIADGNHWMFDFENQQAEAEQALALIQKYGFTHSCYVGRPQASFTYLRR